MANQRGLTLLEMLIATLILTTVLSLASNAYSYYVVGFNKSQTRIQQQLQQTKASLAWQEQLSAAFDYAIKTSAYSYKPWFKGGKDNVSWVAATSMQQPGQAAVVWLGIKDNNLTYCERLIVQQLFTTPNLQPETLCNTYSKTIQSAKNLSVQYYSWPSVRDRQNAMSDFYPGMQIQPAAWFNHIDAFETGLLPHFIKLTIETDGAPETVWVRIENIDIQRLGLFMRESDG